MSEGPFDFRALLLCAVALSTACGGNDPPANDPRQCPPGHAFNGQSCVAWTPPAPSGSAPDAGPPPPPDPTADKYAKPVDPALAAAATQLIAPAAREAAPPGAQPMNAKIAGDFQQGQVLESVVKLEAGKCYTVVGAGVPTVQNLDIQLIPVTPLPGVAPVVAQDQTTAPLAVVGAKPNCFKALFAGPIKVVLAVSAGQGLAAAEIYVK
jgi:hypothetical protein